MISGEHFLLFNKKTPKGQDDGSSKLSGKRTEIGQYSGKIFISPKGQFP
jgi:hypothetical protein